MNTPAPTPATDRGTQTLLQTTARLANWLDEHNGAGPAELGMRIMKIGEEFGEVVAAWIGTTGQNPRKGHTHATADVAAELADVVITALVAMHSLGYHPADVLATVCHNLAARLDHLGAS